MKKFTSMILMLLFACAIAIGAAGCNKGTDGLLIWWPSGRDYRQIIDDVLEDFKADYPDLEVKVAYKDMDAFDAYKMALQDDKTRPDVAIIDHVYVQALAQSNQLLNLSENVSDGLKAKYPEALYNANSYNGNVYALPMSANTVVLMVNPKILKDCGVVDGTGEADIPETFEELIAACEKIKAAGKTAFAQPMNSFAAMPFASYVSRNGGSMMSADGKTVTFDNEGVKKALANWKELANYANTNAYEEDKFYTGGVAFCEMGSWSLSNVTGAAKKFDCAFAEMVTIDASLPNYSGLGLYSLCIPEKTRNKEAALALAERLSTNKDVQLKFNKAKNLFPVTNEALSDSYYTGDAALKVFASQLRKVTPRPATPVWPDMEQAIINMLREVVTGNTSDFSAVTAKYNAKVQSALDRLYK